MGRNLDWLCADAGAGVDASLTLSLDRGGVLRGPGGEIHLQRHEFASGLRLYDTRVRNRARMQVRPQIPHRDPFIAAQVVLAGRSTMHFDDGGHSTTSAAHGSFFRPRGHESRFELDGPQVLHQVGVAADLPLLAHWFGDRVPASLRPYLDDRLRASRVASLPVPAVRAAAAGLLQLPCRGELRTMMREGIALQMLAGFLDALCGNEASTPMVGSGERNAALEARARLLDDMRAPPSVGELARAVGLSARRLDRVFRELFGGSVFAVLRRERLEQAMLALRQENLPVKTIAWRVGYDHVANFSRAFQAQFGLPPSAVRGRRR